MVPVQFPSAPPRSLANGPTPGVAMHPAGDANPGAPLAEATAQDGGFADLLDRQPTPEFDPLVAQALPDPALVPAVGVPPAPLPAERTAATALAPVSAAGTAAALPDAVSQTQTAFAFATAPSPPESAAPASVPATPANGAALPASDASHLADRATTTATAGPTNPPLPVAPPRPAPNASTPPVAAPAAEADPDPDQPTGVRSAELALLLRVEPPPARAVVSPPMAPVQSLAEDGLFTDPDSIHDPQTAPLPLADPPPRPGHAPAPGTAAWVRTFAATLTQAAAQGHDGTVDMVMDPPELGRLRFEMTRVGDQMLVHLVVERPETLDLMRRHADQLLDDLRACGFAEPQLSFGHWGQQQDAPDRPATSAALQTPPPPFPTAPPPAATSAGGLDLRL